MKSLFRRYLDIESQMKALKEEKEAIQEELYIANDVANCPKKTYTRTLDGMKFSCTRKETTKVDQEKAAKIDSPALRIKYELDKRTYNALDFENKKVVEECMETVVSKPTFKVEVVEEENDN